MKILHVIGLVGSGKTYFINKWFPQFMHIFDIKTIYEENNFSPKDLQNDPILFSRFKQALKETLKEFIENYSIDDFFIAESSGTNSYLNQLFHNYEEYRIWINPDEKRIQQTVIKEKRTYAVDLNKFLRDKFKQNQIAYNNIYNPNTQKFEKPLPPFLMKYFK